MSQDARFKLDLATSSQLVESGARLFSVGKIAVLGVLALAAAAGMGARGYATFPPQRRDAVRQELADLGRARYLPQKAIYHVDYGRGWRDRNYAFLLTVLESHERAVGAKNLQIAVILQGDGVDLLALAKARAGVAKRIDGLRQAGVRFLLCKNSLIDRAIDPFKDLHGVAEGDIVMSGVAELVALQQEGYVYLHL